MHKVLVIDDEPQIIRALAINMQARGYEMIAAANAATGSKMAVDKRPDVVLVDLGLPDRDGLTVIKNIRTWSNVPILVLSGRTDSKFKIAALENGADDYITKPFDVEELFARIKAVSRRREEKVELRSITMGDLEIDFIRRTITRTQGILPAPHLTATEWKVLEVLATNRGSLVTKRKILDAAWGANYAEENGSLRLFLSQLRQKLEPNPKSPIYLITELGMGYRFVEPFS
jgi:two-component system KDP operon response regulator KdpE